MSEWKKLTEEQVAWLDGTRGRYAVASIVWADFMFESGETNHQAKNAKLFRVVDHEAARAAGFPMGEEPKPQDETEEKTALFLAWERGHKDGYNEAIERLKDEWQAERRRAWVAFAAANHPGWADEMLSEFDKRFAPNA